MVTIQRTCEKVCLRVKRRVLGLCWQRPENVCRHLFAHRSRRKSPPRQGNTGTKKHECETCPTSRDASEASGSSQPSRAVIATSILSFLFDLPCRAPASHAHNTTKGVLCANWQQRSAKQRSQSPRISNAHSDSAEESGLGNECQGGKGTSGGLTMATTSGMICSTNGCFALLT